MKVSVVISSRNELAMLGVTVRSALEELSVIDGGGEVVIVDNSDERYRPGVEAMIPPLYLAERVRLFVQEYPCLFTAREEAVRQAKGEYIFCVDSHCIFGRGTIEKAVAFMDRAGAQVGFGHIPVGWLCQPAESSRHDMKFLHGTWGKLYDDERIISWKGMPWICRRDWFLKVLKGYGVLSEHRVSWGGGDMYLGLKTWLLGYENWAIPSRPVIHIGPFPKVARDYLRYRLYKKSGEHFPTFGWIVGLYALGADDSFFERPEISSFLSNRINQHFREHLPLGKELAERDRLHIQKNSVRSFTDLIKQAPWENGKKEILVDSNGKDYIDFEPYFAKYAVKRQVGKAIKPEDWYLFQEIVKSYKILGVLEFGAGLSTLLWDALGLRVTSFETDAKYLKSLSDLFDGKNTQLNSWDNESLSRELGPADLQMDLAFVDGIDPRERQIEIAMQFARVIIIHDGYSIPTRNFVAKHFVGWREIKVVSVRSRLFIK